MLPPVLPPARVMKIASATTYEEPKKATPKAPSPPSSSSSEDDDESDARLTHTEAAPPVHETDDGWEQAPAADDEQWETIPVKNKAKSASRLCLLDFGSPRWSLFAHPPACAINLDRASQQPAALLNRHHVRCGDSCRRFGRVGQEGSAERSPSGGQKGGQARFRGRAPACPCRPQEAARTSPDRGDLPEGPWEGHRRRHDGLGVEQRQARVGLSARHTRAARVPQGASFQRLRGPLCPSGSALDCKPLSP
jgi:hypothetical protein